MPFNSYSGKLQDPRWQKRRLEILSRDKFTCQECSGNTEELHVHHCYYLKGVEPWDHPDESLSTLCAGCHKHATEVKRQLDKLIGGTMDTATMAWFLRILSHGIRCLGGENFIFMMETLVYIPGIGLKAEQVMKAELEAKGQVMIQVYEDQQQRSQSAVNESQDRSAA